MAFVVWEGGATAVAQVDTFTVGGTLESTDEYTITLTAEDGSATQSVTVVGGSTDTTTVAETIHAAVAASTQSLFAAITWTQNAAVVTGTAQSAGVPFYAAATTTETGGGAADDQTFVRASSTANAGPNDLNTATNYKDNTLPTGGDTLSIGPDANGVSWAILYGLSQLSGVDLAALLVQKNYKGSSIGDTVNKYYLTIDVSSGSDAYLYINAPQAGPMLFKGSSAGFDRTYVLGIGRGDNALQLDGVLGSLRVKSPNVLGQITIAATASGLSTVHQSNGCRDAKTIVKDFGNMSTQIICDAGEVECFAECPKIEADGTAVVRHYGDPSSGDADTIKATGTALVYLNSESTSTNIGTITVDGNARITTIENNSDGLIIDDCQVHGGTWEEVGMSNMQYSVGIDDYSGGTAKIITDSGATIRAFR